FIAGSINTHRNLASKIARSAKAHALVTDYRLAPENPFPAQLEDAFVAYKWLISEKQINPENIIISGDSAGGNLAISVLIKIRDEGLPLPAAAICLSPVTDLTASGESMISRAESDPMVTPEAIEFMIKSYLDGTDPKNPLASPLYADLSGLPPTFIQAGTAEVLLDDSTRIAQKLESEGVDTELDIWEDMIHVFATFADIAPESKQAIEKIGNFIEKIYARNPQHVKVF
ncbi:MAG: alpha/beta hydrolase, partial [Desulfobacterales bacterium]|nr:alpha/beta hydrolase [Desulfobacterales bacterium]